MLRMFCIVPSSPDKNQIYVTAAFHLQVIVLKMPLYQVTSFLLGSKHAQRHLNSASARRHAGEAVK